MILPLIRRVNCDKMVLPPIRRVLGQMVLPPIRRVNSDKLSYFLNADSEDSDQTGRPLSLI